MAREPHRRITIAAVIYVFLFTNLLALCVFYGVFPFRDPSLPVVSSKAAALAVSSSETLALTPDSSEGFDEASPPTYKKLAPIPRGSIRCAQEGPSAAMKVQFLDTASNPGPFTNLLQRHRIIASLRLLDQVEKALNDQGVCHWLDSTSLLGAFHHATPFPYASNIELGLLISDLQGALTALRYNSKDSNVSVSIEESSGISRLRVFSTMTVGSSAAKGLVYINIYSADSQGIKIHSEPFLIERSDVFPLQRGMMSGRTVWVPKNAETYLRIYFGEEFKEHPRVVDWNTMTYVAPTTLPHLRHYPLVSIVIVTHERYEFLSKSVELIHRQDYPNIEIVIVDDSSKSMEETPYAHLLQVEGLHYHYISGERKSIGEKRNIGVGLAKGAIIAHWDDDDYFREHRITEQVAPILAGDVDMTVLEHHYYFHLPSRIFYIVKRTSAWGPHFGTFVFRRKLFEVGVRYPATSLAEDYAFAEFALKRGATIRVMDNSDGKHVYTRHYNTWEFEFNNYVAQVKKVDKPDFFSDEDFNFFISVPITPPKAKAPNHYASKEISWNRPELRPGWKDSKFKDHSFRGKELDDDLDFREDTIPQYPHYNNKPSDDDGGLSTGAKVGIGVGVTGGAILLGGGVLFGVIYYFRYRQRARVQGGYIALSQEFNL